MEKLMFDLRNKRASIKLEIDGCLDEIMLARERKKNLWELDAFIEETIDRVQELIDRDTQDTASTNI